MIENTRAGQGGIDVGVEDAECFDFRSGPIAQG